MIWLVIRSWLLLIRIAILLRSEGLAGVQRALRKQKVRQHATSVGSEVAVCRAVDIASVFYLKPVLCLQRSAVASIMLRRCGHGAEMVIGAQVCPLKSHAWVEIGHVVVNDKPYMREIYREMVRC